MWMWMWMWMCVLDRSTSIPIPSHPRLPDHHFWLLVHGLSLSRTTEYQWIQDIIKRKFNTQAPHDLSWQLDPCDLISMQSCHQSVHVKIMTSMIYLPQTLHAYTAKVKSCWNIHHSLPIVHDVAMVLYTSVLPDTVSSTARCTYCVHQTVCTTPWC